MRNLYIFLILGVVLLSACENVDISQISDEDMERIADKAIVCNDPYMRFGTGCCLDSNNNKICDNDEQEVKTETKSLETTAESEDNTEKEDMADTNAMTDSNFRKIQWTNSNEVIVVHAKDYQDIADKKTSLIQMEDGDVSELAEFLKYSNVKAIVVYPEDIKLGNELKSKTRINVFVVSDNLVRCSDGSMISIDDECPVEEAEESTDEVIEEQTTNNNRGGSSGGGLSQVTLTTYIDYEDPYSIKFFKDTYPRIESSYIDEGLVKFEIRHYPLDIHPNAWKSAEAVECARDQGYFWDMHYMIISEGANDVSGLLQYAEEIGMTLGRFEICLEDGEKYGKVENDVSSGKSLDISGVPVFFIESKRISGAQPYDIFSKTIDEALGIEIGDSGDMTEE